MESQLTVSGIQTHLFWEDPTRNRTLLGKLIADLPPTDLVVLPEMFTTGFTMKGDKFAESMKGTTVQWMKTQASQKNTAIAGSTIISEGNQLFNRFLFVTPSGEIHFYDKRHTFTLAGEGEVFAAGKDTGMLTYLGWKIGLRVCYDLRFPAWNRNLYDYDLLIFTANWPSKRIAHWDTLLKARAIENMTYCMGVNRVGDDGSQLHYPGHSALYDFMGEKVAQCIDDQTHSFTVQLKHETLQTVRQKLPFLQDRDSFTIQP